MTARRSAGETERSAGPREKRTAEARLTDRAHPRRVGDHIVEEQIFAVHVRIDEGERFLRKFVRVPLEVLAVANEARPVEGIAH